MRDDSPPPSEEGEFPPIEHVRLEIPGEPEKGLPRIIIEERGLRSFARREYRENIVTLAELVLNLPDPADLFNGLLADADRVIVSAGERGFKQVLEEAERDAKEFADEPSFRDSQELVEITKLQSWATEIAKRHGYLSSVSIAANFHIIADRLRRMIGPNEKLLFTIFAFCDAWHLHHMEATGEHALAASAYTIRAVPVIPDGYAPVERARAEARKGLQSGPVARRAQKSAAVAILEEHLKAFWQETKNPNFRNSPTEAAKAILEPVNKQLAKNGLPPYSSETVRKKVTELIRTSAQFH